MKRLLFTLCAVSLVAISLSAQPPIRVMLLDGEMNPYHRWDLTSPVLKKILDEPGKFSVDVVTAPPQDSAMGSFMPKFSDYQVIVLNYDVPAGRWGDALKKSFEQYMTNGGGLVVIHAANNSFPEWKEYNTMIGVGGWRNRNEASGPYWYYKDNKLVSDPKPGNAGSHGNRIPFPMKVVDPNHPITKGLPPIWMHQSDELYAQLRGPGNNMTVLVTAYSDPANRGTGYDEPQLMVLNYGKGRIFHYAPGHDVAAMSSVDYVVLLQRGTEWAATGKVTQKVPDDFPTPKSVAYRVDISKMDPGPAAPRPAVRAANK
ncbi:ThuA domain-containing protein [Spirosoma aerolatum]|uniref:ThuA domain-containing protein n=1 Tax=Spirosoma aerolatum TaxID=1211326 RepID=UPI0009AD7169|nr:ThuA domain-containing protein [Spirosoma aerolatum]